MTSLPAKVIAIERRGNQSFQAIIQIGPKYRGSFNTLAFGDIKPYSGALKDGRVDLLYYRDPRLERRRSISTLDSALKSLFLHQAKTPDALSSIGSPPPPCPRATE